MFKHKINKIMKNLQNFLPIQSKALTLQSLTRTRGVAQLVSAPRSGRGGRKFESSHPDNCLRLWILSKAFFYYYRRMVLEY